MGQPRRRRSGQPGQMHHLQEPSNDLHAPAADSPDGASAGGAPRLPPLTHANDIAPSVPEEKGSDLLQEGNEMKSLSGTTVMPLSLTFPFVTSQPQVTAAPSKALRMSSEVSSSSYRSFNYTLHAEGDDEEVVDVVQEHLLLPSTPPGTPVPWAATSSSSSSSSSSSRHGYVTTRAANRNDRNEALENDTHLAHSPEEGGEGTTTTTTTTPTTTTTTTTDRIRNHLPPLPPTTTTITTTNTTASRRIKRTTTEPKRWPNRTQRSAPSQRRLIQPSPDPFEVCRNNPCGKVPSCHPSKEEPRGFVCYCDDKTKVEPGGSCPRGEILSTHPPPKPLPKGREQVYKVWPMGLASVLVVALLLLVFWRRKSLCAWLRHRHREKKSNQQPQDSISKSNSLVAYASNPNYYTQGPDTQTVHSLPVRLIRPEQIYFIGELGEGCFGKVYKGTYTSYCPETEASTESSDEGGEEGRRNQEGGGGGEGGEEGEDEEIVAQTVAVKVIKESAGAKGEDDFMREVKIMSDFSHPNILTLIGIVMKGSEGTPWMVFEFMPYGDLAELLRSCGPHFYSNHTPVTSLSKSDLLRISIQIASGMEYLSSLHFVHRDLACRNCLVGDNLTVKISDFGMSRDVYTCDYYKIGGSRMLPVRWMAPESIMYGKFTLESDVWSFGVVLWEIYSFGKQPYYGNSNENVVKLIFQGILLSPPDTCPAQVCDVMRRCWATDPTDRLKFPDIFAHLKWMRGEGKGVYPHDTSPLPPVSPCSPPVTYSQLCMQEEASTGHLDQDLYLVPKPAEPREYITVLNV